MTFRIILLEIQLCARLFYVRRLAEGIGLSAWSAAVDDVFGKMGDKFTPAGRVKSHSYGGVKVSLSAFFPSPLLVLLSQDLPSPFVLVRFAGIIRPNGYSVWGSA